MHEKKLTTFRMKSYLNTKKGDKIIDLFGHHSRGVPGLEIKGMGNLGAVLKEKLIFFTRLHGYKIPLKKFVLCAEIDVTEIERAELHYLELPLLVLFWGMSDILKITRLDNCLASGKMNVDGEIKLKTIVEKHPYTYIASQYCEYPKKINIEELFGEDSFLFVKFIKSTMSSKDRHNLGDIRSLAGYTPLVAPRRFHHLNSM